MMEALTQRRKSLIKQQEWWFGKKDTTGIHGQILLSDTLRNSSSKFVGQKTYHEGPVKALKSLIELCRISKQQEEGSQEFY